MVGAKKWSKMKHMVENNLTTFFGRIWEPTFDHSTIYRKLLTRPFSSPICVAKNPNQVSSPVTGCIHRLPASFVIGRSPAHIISCRLCSFHADCAFSGHRPVTGRIRRNPASFAIAPATGSQQILYAWPATGLHECMQGRLPAHNRCCM